MTFKLSKSTIFYLQNISNNSSLPAQITADAGPNIAGVVGLEIVFDGSKSQGDNLSYLWNFGNGETANGKIVKYAYKYPGHYIASLTVSSGSYQSSGQVEVYIYPVGIYVSEFISNPDGSDEEGEWIEIANSSDSIADISDFQIGDNSSSIFKIPKNTYVAPKSFLVFSRTATKISLNNDEDRVVLYYPSGEIADSVEYKSGVKEGFSAARTNGGNFLWTKNSTPGTANVFLNESVAGATTAPSSKTVSENKTGGFQTFSPLNSSVVGNYSGENLISFLPEASAKTVDGYDEGDLADAAGSPETGLPDGRYGAMPTGGQAKTNQSASLVGALKNNYFAVFILISSFAAAAFVFYRRKFWR